MFTLRCADCHTVFDEAETERAVCPKCDSRTLIILKAEGEPMKQYKLSENDRRMLKSGGIKSDA